MFYKYDLTNIKLQYIWNIGTTDILLQYLFKDFANSLFYIQTIYHYILENTKINILVTVPRPPRIYTFFYIT